MRAVLILSLAALLPASLLAGILPVSGKAPAPVCAPLNLEQSSLSQLEERINSIDLELEKLARVSMRSGAGSVGCQSAFHDEPDHTEWVQVDLGQPTPIDQIVLVPTIWRDSKTGFDATGLPLKFQIRAGTDPDSKGIVLASFTEKDHLTPRTAPIVISCETKASWVRVEASILSQGGWDTRYNFELAELMLFNGEENVALRKPVTTSSVSPREGSSRKKEFLVDGFVPYVMDAGRGTKKIPFSSAYAIGVQPSILIDLGATYPINRIHLHSSDGSDSVPKPISDGHGLPGRLVMEGAIQADFSDAVPLFEYRHASIFDAGPIIMRRFQETRCRYVRLTALESYHLNSMGFAEIEVFSNGENKALHKSVDVPHKTKSRPTPLLTDGSNLYGRILPVRQWMNELALRHDLERERPLITAELNQRYAQQQINLQRLGWLSALLGGGIVILFLVDRMLRMRHIARIKERFAADLHDELGANLHTISLIGELAKKKAATSPERLPSLLQQIQATTKRSIVAVHHVSDLQTATGLYKGLIPDMKRAAERIVVDLEHKLSVSGEQHLATIDQQKQVDLFLFYKECLINCCRHSDATELSTRLVVGAKTTLLTVTDNGSSPADHGTLDLPPSLKRRAKILGAHVTLTHPDGGGWRISLRLRNKRRWPRLLRAGK
jgi:signal transduction histidine kinase